MRILVDCDGVLGDFATRVLEWCNTKGRLITLSDFTSFDLLEPVGLTHLQGELDSYLFQINHCRHMPVYPGAVDFLDTLRRLGHEVVIVTSPYEAVPDWCSERTKWLNRHFEIPKKDVIFAKRKELINGEILIDDKTQNCVDFNHHSPSGWAYCLDRPWNQDFKGTRAHSYGEILERL